MNLLDVRDLTTDFSTPHGRVTAVDHVSIALDVGRTLAIVGESGSGKTTLARSIMGTQRRDANVITTGEVLLGGVDIRRLPDRELRRLWGDQISVVQQNPLAALNPVMRVGSQISEVLRHRKHLKRGPADQAAVALMTQVGIPAPQRRMREYPHQLSGGMRQRIAIAIALAGQPKLLIADEPTTALDVTVQAQILRLLRRLQLERSMAMIFISHDLAVVAGIADEVCVMYAGRVVERGKTSQVLGRPRMPYTVGLLNARPRIEAESQAPLASIPGRPPRPGETGAGCPFAPRCARATDDCTAAAPPLREDETGHFYACWHPVVDDGR